MANSFTNHHKLPGRLLLPPLAGGRGSFLTPKGAQVNDLASIVIAAVAFIASMAIADAIHDYRDARRERLMWDDLMFRVRRGDYDRTEDTK